MGSKRIVVGMSGGVDSSLAAALLKKEGHEVIGLFMKNWEETSTNGTCQSLRDYEDVARTCEILKIEHYSINFVEAYRARVFEQFLADLRAGLTPNPDILCNREIKFSAFLDKAFQIGADFLATGHYCQLDAQARLMKGRDPNKDQSYFLHAVKQKAFERVLFPVGHLPKQEVRRLSREYALPTSEKKDSTGICFIGKRDFKPFVSQFLGYQKGKLLTTAGQCVGTHDGAAYYTIGQRRGLGLGGEGDAWYVVGKNIERNEVFVERGANHPSLFSSELIANQITWVAEPPPSFPYRCTAKVRYRQADQLCTLIQEADNEICVQFDVPQRAITPGQSVVFYAGDLCLGGGLIKQKPCL